MCLRLFSQVNGDSDLIEAWLNYYLQLGVGRFHLIVHGPPSENERLLAIKDSYPVTIEETYEGPFPAPIDPYYPTRTEKKRRLDGLLARHTGEWVLVADSDEFVELPYQDLAETVRKLESADANVMAAPMLQRLTADGTLETPSRIDEPFEVFPLCSVDVYWRMGMKAEIFKFPLFYCANGTELVEEGNHHPPLGLAPKDVGIVGVTHHFKFRRSVWGRLEKRINSPHAWRSESVGCRDYLDSHGGRLPLDGAFPYSRQELFRRRLLRPLPSSRPPRLELSAEANAECHHTTTPAAFGERVGERCAEDKSSTLTGQKIKIMLVLPQRTGIGGLERYLRELFQKLQASGVSTIVVCFSRDVISACMDNVSQAQAAVQSLDAPQSFWEWYQIFRQNAPDTVIFCNTSVAIFPWQAQLASLFARVPKRISIHYLVPPVLPPPIQAKSLRGLLRCLVGRRARKVAKVKWSAKICDLACSATVCVCGAIRDALVRSYRFRPSKSFVIFKGVPTSSFVPSPKNREAVRAFLDIDPVEFLLVCATRLIEEKGLDILIHAVSQVVRQGISCRCLIVGDGPVKEGLIRLANFLGLAHHVFFIGFQQDVRPYLQAASAFVLTSRMEGLPMSVLEAMACGLPCIVTNSGGNSEAVQDHVNGLVVPLDSAAATADAILYLATNPETLKEMASKAREIAVRDFDFDDRFTDLRPMLLG